MKKTFIAGCVAATLGIAGFNAFETMPFTNLSNLALQNIEALSTDEIILDEVEIVCDSKEGKCWKNVRIYFEGEYTYNECEFCGDPLSFCTKI